MNMPKSASGRVTMHDHHVECLHVDNVGRGHARFYKNVQEQVSHEALF